MISRSSPSRFPDELSRQLATAWEDVEYAVTIVALDGRITYANPACTELYGHTLDELTALRFETLFATKADAIFTESDEHSTPRTRQTEVLAVRKDGARFNAHIANSPVLDDAGGLAGHIVIHRDITAEIQARDLLRISAETQSKGANESAAIVKLGWIANSSLNVGEVYDQLAVELRRLVTFDRISVWAVDAQNSSATAVYVRGNDLPGSRLGGSIPVENSIMQTLVLSRSAVVYGDSEKSPRDSYGSAANEVGLKSMLAVPLIANDLVVAIMVLRSRKTDAYSDQDLALVRRAGMQTAGAIANSGLYETVRQEAEHRQGLAEIGRVVSSSPRIEDVYDRFADEVRELIPCDRFAVSVTDGQHGTYVSAYTSGIDVPELRPGAATLSGSLSRRVTRQRAGIMTFLESESQAADQSPGLLSAYRAGLRSLISVPLISMNEVIGIMHVSSTAPQAYTERDLTLAERIASQASGAMANSQLYCWLSTEMGRKVNGDFELISRAL
ncbi:MAG: GAF domain-containing protein [SAR202 cluster bacterium]|nr:GAF domain-containing protein [SAR202 cluster bacterium]